MRIAVFGSWKSQSTDEWLFSGTQAQFELACRQLGNEMARRGHSVVVISDNLNTADYHIVQGVLEVASENDYSYPLIEILVTPSSRIPFTHEASQYLGLFSYFHSASERWSVNHLLTLREADAVLIIGGGKGSFDAGIACIVAGKRFVPIGAFGGAAIKLHSFMNTLNVQKYSDLISDEYRRFLLGPWTPVQLQKAICALGLCDFPRLMIIHGRSSDRDELKYFLEAVLSLPEPIIMGQEFNTWKTLPEKFEDLTQRVDGVIALATPDDIGAATLSPDGQSLPESHWTYQRRARQNVWIEVGWAWGNLSRKRILILVRGNVEIPSDLQGIEMHSYKESPQELTNVIQAFIEHLRNGNRN